MFQSLLFCVGEQCLHLSEKEYQRLPLYVPERMYHRQRAESAGKVELTSTPYYPNTGNKYHAPALCGFLCHSGETALKLEANDMYQYSCKGLLRKYSSPHITIRV